MSSTIRIDPVAKTKLKKLQEWWLALKRDEPSQEALVGKCIEYVERHKDQFMVEASWRPMTEKEFLEFSKSMEDDLGAWSVGDIDEIVYGGD